MVECPICRSGSRDSGSICPGCGIPSSLTEVILEIAGPKPEPKLARAMAELLGAAGIAPELRPPRGITPDRSGALQAAPVPPPVRNAYPAPMPEVGDRSPPPAPIPTRPEGGLVSVEQNIRSIVELGNELGLQAPGLVEEARAALEAGDRPQLAALRRQAFQLVSSALVDEYGKIHAARDRLRSVAPVDELDAQLRKYRTALNGGDLKEASRHRTAARVQLDSHEDRRKGTQRRLDETELMVRTLREMGGIPSGTLRQVVEALADARRGNRSHADERLTSVNQTLWKLLSPRMTFELTKIRGRLAHAAFPTDRSELIGVELKRMAEHVKRRELGAAIDSYRVLRLAMPTPARVSRTRTLY